MHGGTGPKCLVVEAYCVAQDKPIEKEKVIEIMSDVKLKEILSDIEKAKDRRLSRDHRIWILKHLHIQIW